MRGRVNYAYKRLVLKLVPVAEIIFLLSNLAGMEVMTVKTFQGRMKVLLTKSSCQLF